MRIPTGSVGLAPAFESEVERSHDFLSTRCMGAYSLLFCIGAHRPWGLLLKKHHPITGLYLRQVVPDSPKEQLARMDLIRVDFRLLLPRKIRTMEATRRVVNRVNKLHRI